ncbi:MAG: tetratricopeptide repeat protein [Sphingomonadales bacterium]|nr:tetratricopeptide repeat protein [Sphingomonadales bacterium]
MPKSSALQINSGRIAIIVAGLVLAAALWIGHARTPSAPSAPPPATPAPMSAPPPQDADGWRRLGESQSGAGRYADAVGAYEKATALAPQRAELWSALGEARVMASAHDPMPQAAIDDFDRAIARDARDPRARYFLAVARDLRGDHRGAIADWLALLADTPPGAPWEADLRRTIVQVGRINHIAVAARLAAIRQPPPAVPAPPPALAGIPGPTTEDLRAASAIPPSQQQAMAQGMVAQLEARLAADPHNGEGWAMLVRSKLTLGGPQAAAQTLDKALAADPADAAMLRAEARAMGVR